MNLELYKVRLFRWIMILKIGELLSVRRRGIIFEWKIDVKASVSPQTDEEIEKSTQFFTIDWIGNQNAVIMDQWLAGEQSGLMFAAHGQTKQHKLLRRLNEKMPLAIGRLCSAHEIAVISIKSLSAERWTLRPIELFIASEGTIKIIICGLLWHFLPVFWSVVRCYRWLLWCIIMSDSKRNKEKQEKQKK